MSASAYLEPCAIHPLASAGWRCTSCDSLLCPSCTGFRKMGEGRIDSCLRCGGVAHQLRLSRALLQPFAQTLPSAIRWPFTRETALTALSAAVVVWLFAKVGSFAALIADGIVIAFLFHVVRHSAKGHDDLADPGDFRGFFEDVLGPIFRCLAASVWAWGPFIAYVMLHEGGFFVGSVAALNLRTIAGPIPILLLLGGTLLFPMSLLAGALEVPLLQQLNPLLVIGSAVRLGRDYWLLSGFCLAVSITESMLRAVLGFIDVHLLGLPDVVFYFVLLFPPLMMFRALGLLVRARGDELGYGGVDSFLEPALGATLPAVALESNQEPLAPERTAIEIPDELSSEQPRLVLARKITESDFGGAIHVLEKSGSELPAHTLSAPSWVALGKACLADGRPKLALFALLRAVEVAPQGPLAPQAFLQAARISDESEGDRAHSIELLGELVRLHPDTAEARFAQKRLGR